MVERLILEEIVEARKRGSAVVLETPVLPSTSFSKLSGRDVILKAENLQRTGSFKIRGAMNALSLLNDDQAKRGVVAASAGNHAQGIALAAKTLGIPATVFMPEGAAIPKINATESYGATVKIAGANLGEAVEHARAFESETGARFIHPYDDRAIIAGQGTLGLETLAAGGANLLSVVHHREGSGLPFGMVQIQLTVATRSWSHIDAIVAAFEDNGVIIKSRPTR